MVIEVTTGHMRSLLGFKAVWVSVVVLMGTVPLRAHAQGKTKHSPPAAAPAAPPQTEDEKIFYAVGYSLGGQLAKFLPSSAEVESAARGLAASGAGTAPAVDLNQYLPQVHTLEQRRMAQAKAAYLEKAAQEAGAERLPSGVIYKELKAGSGASPKMAGDTVSVRYQGRLMSGEEFYNSFGRDSPIEVAFKGLIPCWSQGLQKMRAGGKAKLVCPEETVTGSSPPKYTLRPSGIPPSAVLEFEVELVSVDDKGQKMMAFAQGHYRQFAKMEGAEELPKGGFYLELEAGSGGSPTAADTVIVHYQGWCIGGEKFADTYQSNQPAEFPLKAVIPCWSQGLQRMKVGGKAKLTCPPETAYGDNPPPGSNILPGVALEFTVELIKIVGDAANH